MFPTERRKFPPTSNGSFGKRPLCGSAVARCGPTSILSAQRCESGCCEKSRTCRFLLLATAGTLTRIRNKFPCWHWHIGRSRMRLLVKHLTTCTLTPPKYDVSGYTRNSFYTPRVLTRPSSNNYFSRLIFPKAHTEVRHSAPLLTQDCSGCHTSKEKRHRLSLLGSLAHRYRLCIGYEKCLQQLLPMVNHLRDTQAAHSGVEAFRVTTPADSRERLRAQSDKLGHEFLHMLEHIGEIERNMWNDMSERISGRLSTA
jgi:hypothetical protein